MADPALGVCLGADVGRHQPINIECSPLLNRPIHQVELFLQEGQVLPPLVGAPGMPSSYQSAANWGLGDAGVRPCGFGGGEEGFLVRFGGVGGENVGWWVTVVHYRWASINCNYNWNSACRLFGFSVGVRGCVEGWLVGMGGAVGVVALLGEGREWIT